MRAHITHRILFASCILALVPVSIQAGSNSFIGSLNTNTKIASTIPQNGDLNPYGVAVVPASTGTLVQGNILVSNFNNQKNLQGTGTTIVEIAPNGALTTFATINAKQLPGACPGGVGLTTALVVLSSGWVIVGACPPPTARRQPSRQAACWC